MSSIESEWRNYLVGVIDDQNETKKRGHIMDILRSLIPSFVQLSAKENGTIPSDFECQLLPFGSYSLGGHLMNGDLDLVLLAPRSVRRRDFNRFFTKLLRDQPMIREVDCIRKANVPIIKCIIDSIPIDISFVRLHMPTVPEHIDLLDDSLLRGLDVACLASTNGPRVGQFILRSIHPNDLPAFRLALQCIKYWANLRCLYGKPMGYLNGGSWTLLLLKTYFVLQSQSNCSAPGTSTNASLPSHTQIPPNQPSFTSCNVSPSLPQGSSSSSAPLDTPTPTKTTPMLPTPQPISFISLLRRFFHMWSTWPWPKPVILTQSIPIKLGISSHDMNSINDLDCFGTSLLPICTPCYPIDSAAPFVTQSTLSVLTDELNRAQQILRSDSSGTAQHTMAKLFKPLHIVKAYKHFIKVTVSCETIVNHDIWSRRTPRNLTRLVELLESMEEVKVARPLTKSYTDFVTHRTRQERDVLKSGLDVTNVDSHGTLLPGSLYRRFFLVGLEFHDRYKHQNIVVDISEIVNVFSKEIDEKKNGRDSDVNIHISAIKRRDVADIIQV